MQDHAPPFKIDQKDYRLKIIINYVISNKTYVNYEYLSQQRILSGKMRGHSDFS